MYIDGDTVGFSYVAIKALNPFSISSLLSDPFSGRGFPWIFSYGTMDPIVHFMRLIFNEFQTLAWICYIYFSLGGLLFAIFLKNRGNSTLSSFVGGLVFSLSFFWVGDGDYSFPFLLPLFASILILIQGCFRHLFRNGILITLMVAYGWLAGHFNFVPLILVGCGIFAVLQTFENKKPNKRRVMIIAYIFACFLLGTFLGMARLLPALANLQFSERAGGLSAEVASTVTLNISSLITAFFPYMVLPFLNGSDGTLFFGVTALSLLIIGLLYRSKHKFAFAAFVTCVLIAIPNSPLYWLIQNTPLFSYLRVPIRWMFLANAAVAVIVANIFDEVVNNKLVGIRKRVGSIFFCIGVAFFVISVVFTIVDLLFSETILSNLKLYFDSNLYGKTSGLPLEHYHQYIDGLWRRVISIFSVSSPKFLLSLIGLLLTGLYMWKYSINKVLLTLLIVFTSVSPFFFYHKTVSINVLESVKDIYENEIEDEYVMSILPGLADFTKRFVVFGENDNERMSYQLALLSPNRHALLNVKNIDFYQPVQPTRMARLLASIGSGNAPVPKGENLEEPIFSPDERIEILKDRYHLFAALNVSKVVSAWNLPKPFVWNSDIRPVDRLPEIHIYNVPDVRPIIYSAEKFETMSPDEDKAIEFMKSIEDPELSLIECEKCPDIQGGEVDIDVITDEDLLVEFDVYVESSSWIVVSRPRIPGWRVEMDGEGIDTAIANGMFFGIPVKKGDHKVKMYMNYKTLFVDSLKILMGN